jgi:3-oxoacyl-[acyl-carrier protein] reductase
MIEKRMTGWTDQVAIVTGSSRGIGRTIARALAARGVAICINYAGRTAEAETVAAEIAAEGGRVIAVQADVADADAASYLGWLRGEKKHCSMVAKAVATYGRLAILVNNAGISGSSVGDHNRLAGWGKYRNIVPE